MSEELKPCPWCGEAGELTIANDRSYFYVDCTNNDCMVQPATGYEGTRENAILAWNTRADSELAALALRCVKYVPMTEKELREATIAAAGKVKG